MLKEKNSAGGGKFNFFNFLKEKENNQAEPINVKDFIPYLKNKIINEKYEITREEAIFLSQIPNNDMENILIYAPLLMQNLENVLRTANTVHSQFISKQVLMFMDLFQKN